MNPLSMKSPSTPRMRSALAGAALAAIVAGCGTMAEINPALDRTPTSYRALQRDPPGAQRAPGELRQAGEAVRTADTAWTQRESLRTVGHLTYLAQQRIAIARETADTRMWEGAAATAKADADSEKARADRDKAARDLSIAGRDAREKAIELAAAKAVAQQDKSYATDLEMQLTDPNATQTDRGDVITLGDVLFDSNRAELSSGILRDCALLGGVF